ncbi:hypothetical protein OS493_023321, partial [Desmophyllum pertusum]
MVTRDKVTDDLSWCSLAFNVAALLYPFDRYLLRTKLKILSLDSFIGHNVQDSRMVIEDRKIAKVTYVTASRRRNITIYLRPIKTETIRVTHLIYFREVIGAVLVASGFTRIPDANSVNILMSPCPLGTFSNSSAKGTDGCTKCPP